jgi:hypothetical protein
LPSGQAGHLTINPLIFLYFLILDSISIVFTTLSTLFLDEHVVETIALQEIDTIVVPFVTLAHAHIGGNHDVSFTIMHTGDVGITGSAFNAGMLFWIEDRVAAIDVLIVVTITGNSVGCPLPPYRSYDNRDNHNFPLQDSVQSLA